MGILHPNDCDQAIVESVGSNLRAYSLPALLFVWEIYWLVWDLTGSTVLQKTPPSAGVSHFEPEQEMVGVRVDCNRQIFKGMRVHR